MAKERLPRIVAPLGGGTGITSDHRLVTGVTGRGRALSLSDGMVAMPARQTASIIPNANTATAPSAAPIWKQRQPSYQASGLMFVPFEATSQGDFIMVGFDESNISLRGIRLTNFFQAPYEDTVVCLLDLTFEVHNGRPRHEEYAFFVSSVDAIAHANENSVSPPAWLNSVPYGITYTDFYTNGYHDTCTALSMQGVAAIRNRIYPMPDIPEDCEWDPLLEGLWYITADYFATDMRGVSFTEETQWIITEDTSTFSGFPVKLTYRYQAVCPAATISDTFTATLSWFFPEKTSFVGDEADFSGNRVHVTGENTRSVSIVLPQQAMPFSDLGYAACLTAPLFGRNDWAFDS